MISEFRLKTNYFRSSIYSNCRLDSKQKFKNNLRHKCYIFNLVQFTIYNIHLKHRHLLQIRKIVFLFMVFALICKQLNRSNAEVLLSLQSYDFNKWASNFFRFRNEYTSTNNVHNRTGSNCVSETEIITMQIKRMLNRVNFVNFFSFIMNFSLLSLIK